MSPSVKLTSVQQHADRDPRDGGAERGRDEVRDLGEHHRGEAEGHEARVGEDVAEPEHEVEGGHRPLRGDCDGEEPRAREERGAQRGAGQEIRGGGRRDRGRAEQGELRRTSDRLAAVAATERAGDSERHPDRDVNRTDGYGDAEERHERAAAIEEYGPHPEVRAELPERLAVEDPERRARRARTRARSTSSSRPSTPPVPRTRSTSATTTPSAPKATSPRTSPKNSGKKTASHGVGSVEP